MTATKTLVQTENRPAQKREISLEAFIFIALFVGYFGVFAWKMGMVV